MEEEDEGGEERFSRRLRPSPHAFRLCADVDDLTRSTEKRLWEEVHSQMRCLLLNKMDRGVREGIDDDG